MKQFKPLLFVLLLLAVANIKAAETEPNNNKAQANTLALNGSNSGKINAAGDTDWWKLTTNGDGKLNISLTPLSGRHTYIYLYDNDGVTLLKSSYSSGAFTQSTDGLAAGTYFIKIACYYANDTSSYTLSNTLTKPVQANDTEPNDTKTAALTLPYNGSTTGHIGYYYNNQRDTFDWYKVTTTQDGLLRLRITSYSGQHVWAYLYDNDGTTQLGAAYSTSTAEVSKDGLTAGTYYVRVNCYYTNYEFAPYKLEDSLFTPAQANDAEPNNNRASAITLPFNGSTTGHVGYYYNNQRDTFDWYKVTTTEDGLLRVRATSYSGHYIYAYLYDNDGTTLLDAAYSTSTAQVTKDGLAPGTYYVRLNCYYTSYGFAPYKLEDSLFTYANTTDIKNNDRAYLAQTLPANTATPGHIGFYYKNVRDTSDWWRINYTGSGALSVALNLEPTKSGGGQHTYMQIYKDTNEAPLYSAYTTSGLTANFTGLTQGYYWVRVREYYSYDFESYTLTPTFTQANVAKITLTSYDTVAKCSAVNKMVFKCSNSKAPYKVVLYRFGTVYDSIVSTKAAVTFNNLPAGSYYATVYGDGATGTAFGKSKTVAMEPIPTGLSTTNIQTAQAKLNWSSVACADYFMVRYRVHGTTTWSTKKTNGNVTSFVLKGLTANTTYDWAVAAADAENGITAIGTYAGELSFTTATTLIAGTTNNEEESLSAKRTTNTVDVVNVSPNPATSYFVIHVNSSMQNKLSAILMDLNGKQVWSSGLINASVLNGKQVNVSGFAKGTYILRVMAENSDAVSTIKVAVM